MDLTSEAFKSGDKIPERYTCNGQDNSPPLMWRNIPDNTESFVIIMDDPDAAKGVFTHWVLYNIPPDIDTLEENFTLIEHPDWHAAQGRNSFGKSSYGGPCPPPLLQEHRYYFRLYALDTRLNMGPGATRDQVMDEMEGHILDSSELMGRFEREYKTA